MPRSIDKKSTGSDYSHINKELKSDLQQLIGECKLNLKIFDEELISKAFHFCAEAHKNKIHQSGEPFYKHPLKVAHIVLKEIPMDQTSVICALLHDIPNDSDVFSTKDIQKEFGYTISEIVDGISKIQTVDNKRMDKERYRKLLLSLFKDVRIILIKSAEMLQNLRTIKFLDIEEQLELANEVLDYYSPFASRFGLGNLKWELEDIAFSIRNPSEYQEIKNKIKRTHKEREEFIKEFMKPVEARLHIEPVFKKNNIQFEIEGRAKHIYSIYNKTIIRGLPFEKLNDLFAIRIILDTDVVKYCYLTYGILTDIYEPIVGTFKNYIANPKKNGYQSIHSAFKHSDGSHVEVQIRTREMHELSEKGLAAHFNYKRGLLPAQSIIDDKNLEDWLNLVRSVFENSGAGNSGELLDNIKKNWYSGEIFAFTPQWDFKRLPKDATAIDFAYQIHGEKGEHCLGAKVNGKIVPLDYKIQSGDQVEILTSKKQEPKKEWLDLVVTRDARYEIKKYLRKKLDLEYEKGKAIWDEYSSITELNISYKKLRKFFKSLYNKSENDFFISLGATGLDEKSAFNKIEEILGALKNFESNQLVDKQNSDMDNLSEQNILRKSNNQYLKTENVKFSKCCYPIPGDDIVGIMASDGKSVIIHRNNCLKLKSILGGISVSTLKLNWSNINVSEFISKIIVLTEDKQGIFNEITKTLSTFGQKIIQEINFTPLDDGFKGFITIPLKDKRDFSNIKSKLELISGIKSVERYCE